uniref:Biotin and thiamin synthesis-associated domain-containing protein n=1 Tax=Aureoumbra lagunensis TaxID=44058 RepID=A0A7S3JMV3_9STRA|mmetsp:Transcript_17406/g.22641  ORF Transcript_17406/g.22641 Transcript_17406/m.22641 type:complete len:567 (+) Transcript_17406:72-1772(+)
MKSQLLRYSKLLKKLSRPLSTAVAPELTRQQIHGSAWSKELDKEAAAKIPRGNEIINEKQIFEYIEKTKEDAKDVEKVREVLSRALERATLTKVPNDVELTSEYVQGLNGEEAATLLNIDSTNRLLMSELFKTALDIKERIYGNRIVLFAPLYLANYCVNSCTYCAFRSKNKHIARSSLTDEEIRYEVETLEKMGHRRLLLLTGEHPKYTFDDFLRVVHVVAGVRTEPCGNIRRINVEIPALSISDFRRLKETGEIGTYTLFQETYHKDSFKHVHPDGPKSDFEYRLQTMDRAQIAGIDDVGIGALFGLFDYRFEALAMLQHANHLEKHYKAGPHTISIPRMRPADQAPSSIHPPAPVSDADFLKLVAVLRCAVPYTGMILSTRESAHMRRKLLHLGISQMSAGSKTDVGAYAKGDQQTELDSFGTSPHLDLFDHLDQHPETQDNAQKAAATELKGQFSLLDHRSLDEIVRDLMDHGFVPSWCTACYRTGRTGKSFMNIAKRGNIHNYCHPNAMLTLQEYIQDYASDSTKKVAERVIEKEKKTLSRPDALNRKLEKIMQGERDLYF